MPHFTIDELIIPDSIDSADAADFIEMTAVRNTIEAAVVGNRDLAYEAAELLPNWQDPYQPQRLLVARSSGRIIARGLFMPTMEEGARDVWLSVEVLPEHRRQGVGSALYERLLDLAADSDRRILQCNVLHAVAPPHAARGGDVIASPTGFGHVPRLNPESVFLAQRGFGLEQVERLSRLPLPVASDVLDRHMRDATSTAGAEYRLVEWAGRTPEQWLDDMAVLLTRMSTDAPSADLETVEERWDATRVGERDDRLETSPRIQLTAAVEHVPTGCLVAFNTLSVPPEVDRAVEQLDTLVLTDHRGHRLGMLVKAANIVQLQRHLPGHPSVTTFNAEENRHMLSVNEAIGFAAVGYAGQWKAVID